MYTRGQDVSSVLVPTEHNENVLETNQQWKKKQLKVLRELRFLSNKYQLSLQDSILVSPNKFNGNYTNKILKI